jgi:hypothetical protein
VKGRKIHALVDREGLSMRGVVHYAAIRDRDGAASSSTKYGVASLARTDLGRWRRQRVASQSAEAKSTAAAHRDR